MPLSGCKITAKFRQYQKKSQQSFTDCWDFYKLLMIYAFTATEIQSKTNEQIPNATIPTGQTARRKLALRYRLQAPTWLSMRSGK